MRESNSWEKLNGIRMFPDCFVRKLIMFNNRYITLLFPFVDYTAVQASTFEE